MRRPMLAGNWKMHKLIEDLPGYFSKLAEALEAGKGSGGLPELVFAVPFTLLSQAVRELEKLNSNVRVAAQNFHWAQTGAFTGEVSLAMLAELHVRTALVGHSERRQYFNETDETVAKKVVAAEEAGTVAIVCVGESLAERERQQTEAVVKRQVHAFLEVVKKPKDLIVAYEPVWAIGTGLTATPEQAEEVHSLIRDELVQSLGQETGDMIRILYGGSVKPENVGALVQKPNIDGGLVGGASLTPESFAEMAVTVASR